MGEQLANLGEHMLLMQERVIRLLELDGPAAESRVKNRVMRWKRPHEVQHDPEQTVERVSQPHRGRRVVGELGEWTVPHRLERDDRAGVHKHGVYKTVCVCVCVCSMCVCEREREKEREPACIQELCCL